MSPEQEIKDPLVLEFLGLKDEYSENALEEVLIHRLEHSLLELGSDFAFIALSSQYKLALPNENELAEEIVRTRKELLQETRRTK